MSSPTPSRYPFRRYASAWIGFSAGGLFSQALSVTCFLYALGINTVRVLTGWPGTIAILITLVVFAGISLFGQRHHLEWHGILPISLLALFAFMAASVLWTQYTWATVGGFFYAAAFGSLGLYLALGRDLVQVIRAAGDALRILLVVSLSLEVFSGLLIDEPITFLGITGSISRGGPIQGVAGTRNFMGFLAALGLVTFVVEWLMKSVRQGQALASIVVAVIALVLSSSPITAIAMLVLVVAALALRSLRNAPPSRRPYLQGTLAVLVMVGIVAASVFRRPLLTSLGATSDVSTRLNLWSTLRTLIDIHPITGWGWLGPWHSEIFPFSVLVNPATGRPYASGLNAFLDIWFQLGLPGLVLLIFAGGLAFARSWATASGYPGIAYVWPPMIVLLLAVTALAESFVLFEGSLMIFVAVITISARRRSWRNRLTAG